MQETTLTGGGSALSESERRRRRAKSKKRTKGERRQFKPRHGEAIPSHLPFSDFADLVNEQYGWETTARTMSRLARLKIIPAVKVPGISAHQVAVEPALAVIAKRLEVRPSRKATSEECVSV